MAKPKKESVLTKVKGAVSWAKDKNRQGLDSAYEAKKPLALAMLKQLREANPKATPSKIQDLLAEELRASETQFGSASVEFSTAIALFVLASIELHQLDEDDEDHHQKLIDLMMVLDSSAVKLARKAVGVAATAVMFLPQGKAVKGVATARKAVAATATAKAVLEASNTKIVVADKVITRTAKILGPAPKRWSDSEVKPAPRKTPAKKPKK
jgi:hypothetical protein